MFTIYIIILLQVLGYLSSKVDEETGDANNVSVAEVMQSVENSIRQWPSDRLQVYQATFIVLF